MRLKQNLPLLAIILVFTLPILAAAIALKKLDLQQMPTTQNGIFVNPKEQLQFNQLHNLLDATNTSSIEPGKWNLVYVTPNVCTNECTDKIEHMHSLYKILHQHKDKLAFFSATTEDITPSKSVDSFLLIDPNGSHILWYPAQKRMCGLLTDLQKLLKYNKNA